LVKSAHKSKTPKTINDKDGIRMAIGPEALLEILYHAIMKIRGRPTEGTNPRIVVVQ
jgi:hypothetical protein